MSRESVASQRQSLQAGPTTSGPNRAELAKIHIAKRDLKLNDQFILITARALWLTYSIKLRLS